MRLVFISQIVLSLLLVSLPINAIEMEVGETRTLNIGNVSNLKGCQWTISRPNDVVFVTAPQSYSTEVTIKAINPFPASTPCIVHCKYYYLDLDPTTGRYTYMRSDFKDWTIFVGGSGNGGENNSISLSTYSITTYVDEWSQYLTAYTSSDETVSWKITSPDVAVWMYSAVYDNSIMIRGQHEGETTIRATLNNGASAVCKITVLPKRNYKDGEIIYSKTEEGVTLQYKILSVADGTCQLGDENYRYSPKAIINYNANAKKISIPEYVDGFKVVSVSEYAFDWAEWTSIIHLPNTIQEIGGNAFRFCTDLKEINIPEGVKVIKDSTFDNCKNLKSIILPNSVTSIEKGAFHNCTSLSSIVLPNNLETIGDWAFSTCALEIIDLPQNIRSLGSIVFNNCSSIKTVFLRNNILSVSSSTFEDCSNITAVIVTEKSPQYISRYNFNSEVYSHATLYVPYGTKEYYQTLGGWKNFYNIVEMNTDETTIMPIAQDDTAVPIHYYTINGSCNNRLQRGINFMRMNNGTIKKIIVK